ncbi:MAG: glycosyltransferase [Planctomycetaceae bacterium]|nr:glycosyltransferase [Planctomycetaceae bacterium]
MTDAAPKVSVMIYCFNQRQYIEHAVRSVLGQQVSFPLEVLIGDDHSTDGTTECLQALAQSDARIQLITREQNGGAADNFYDLLARCRGEYIAFLDGDDYWTSTDKLAKQIAALEQHAEWSLCFHRVLHVDDHERSLQTFYPSAVPPYYGFAELLHRNLLQTCSVVARRSMIPAQSENARRLIPGDWPLFLLLAERGELGFLPEVMAAYRVHSASGWSSQPRWKRELATLEMLLAMQDEVKPEHRAMVRNACEQRFRELHDCPWHLKFRREWGTRLGIDHLLKWWQSRRARSDAR